MANHPWGWEPAPGSCAPAPNNAPLSPTTSVNWQLLDELCLFGANSAAEANNNKLPMGASSPLPSMCQHQASDPAAGSSLSCALGRALEALQPTLPAADAALPGNTSHRAGAGVVGATTPGGVLHRHSWSSSAITLAASARPAFPSAAVAVAARSRSMTTERENNRDDNEAAAACGAQASSAIPMLQQAAGLFEKKEVGAPFLPATAAAAPGGASSESPARRNHHRRSASVGTLGSTNSFKASSSALAGGGGSVRRCQGDNCQADLTQAKRYYKRRKLCGNCISAPSVMVEGVECRYCQQCSCLHAISEFDGPRRSCRKKLEKHKLRARRVRSSQGLQSRRRSLSAIGDCDDDDAGGGGGVVEHQRLGALDPPLPRPFRAPRFFTDPGL